MTARKRGRPRRKKPTAGVAGAKLNPSNRVSESLGGGESSTGAGKDITPNSNIQSDLKRKEQNLNDLRSSGINPGGTPGQGGTPEEPKNKTFAEITSLKDEFNYGLNYVQTEEMNGLKVARLSREAVEEDAGWNSSLVCCVLGANPSLKVMDGFLSRIWKDYKIADVVVLREGQFVVHFEKEEDRDEIARRKYYFLDNKPMLVQRWKPGCKLNLDELTDIPIWVRFPDLDPKYWSLSGLSKLGSIIGKPVKRDKATATKSKLDFARIQIEVGIQKSFPEMVQFIDEDSRVISQKVEYEWSPTRCTLCKKLGHLEEECRQKGDKQPATRKTMVWRRKQSTPQQQHKEDAKENASNENLEERMDGDKEEEEFHIVTKRKSRLSERECDRLVSSLTDRVTIWASKHMSYAGRNKNNLWVKWIHERYVKGDAVSYNLRGETCYYWKKIIQNRKWFDQMPRDREYTTEEGYRWLMGQRRKEDWISFAWNKLSCSKHQFFAWLICRGRVNTKTRLGKYIPINMVCDLCQGSEEDADHLFSTCPLTKSLLMKICDWLDIRMEGNSVQEIRENLMRVRGRRRDRGISAFVATCYHIWKARNKLFHKQEQPQLEVMYNSILLCLTAYWGKGPKK
ncbi:hypothetical protein DM860_015452 [Cuscuta australis]|uniref:DUF4283 domain-containing protein n=1 Tax=Cuscuta australis TaxID=267555 RepID=A0A328E6T9_9ASTE|nr:hypothetical protein DM860_015452 [Cuscuta australis]